MSHVDAPGFSQSQQRRLGELVLGQRGGLRKIEAGLSRELTAWQVLCLRLAVIECHARGEVDASGLKLARVASGGARLTFTPQWAEEHPRTAYLLREEADLWARQAWAVLGVDGLGVADHPPGPDFPLSQPPKLTVAMVSRLQGFPDGWSFSGRKTAAYRQVGNAFPPPVARALGTAIRQALQG